MAASGLSRFVVRACAIIVDSICTVYVINIMIVFSFGCLGFFGFYVLTRPCVF